MANSKPRLALREAKRTAYKQQHRATQAETDKQNSEMSRQWNAQAQAIVSAPSTRVLGVASKNADHSRFEFEDDSGRQRQMNEEYEEIVDELRDESRKVLGLATLAGQMAKDHNATLDRMNEKVGGLQAQQRRVLQITDIASCRLEETSTWWNGTWVVLMRATSSAEWFLGAGPVSCMEWMLFGQQCFACSILRICCQHLVSVIHRRCLGYCVSPIATHNLEKVCAYFSMTIITSSSISQPPNHEVNVNFYLLIFTMYKVRPLLTSSSKFNGFKIAGRPRGLRPCRDPQPQGLQ